MLSERSNPMMLRAAARKAGAVTRLITEAQFQHTVIETAVLGGWMGYHTYRSDRSETGFPDLVLVHPAQERVVFAELKREGGKLTKGRWNKAGTRWLVGQDEWAAALKQCPGVEYYLWMPSEWEPVKRTLIQDREL